MQIKVSGAGVTVVNGLYSQKSAAIVPSGFAATCKKMEWPPAPTWQKLACPEVDWFESDNGSYIYLHNEGRWWIDDPKGGGIYIANHSPNAKVIAPPYSGWKPLVDNALPLPSISIDNVSES